MHTTNLYHLQELKVIVPDFATFPILSDMVERKVIRLNDDITVGGLGVEATKRNDGVECLPKAVVVQKADLLTEHKSGKISIGQRWANSSGT